MKKIMAYSLIAGAVSLGLAAPVSAVVTMLLMCRKQSSYVPQQWQ